MIATLVLVLQLNIFIGHIFSGEESGVHGVSHEQRCGRVPVPGAAARPGVQHEGQGGCAGQRGQVQGREHVGLRHCLLRSHRQGPWQHDCNCVKCLILVKYSETKAHIL